MKRCTAPLYPYLPGRRGRCNQPARWFMNIELGNASHYVITAYACEQHWGPRGKSIPQWYRLEDVPDEPKTARP